MDAGPVLDHETVRVRPCQLNGQRMRNLSEDYFPFKVSAPKFGSREVATENPEEKDATGLVVIERP